MKLWFLDAQSVYPLLTSQAKQEPCVNLTIDYEVFSSGGEENNRTGGKATGF